MCIRDSSKPTIFLTVHPSVIYHRKAGVSGFKMSYVPKYMAEPILRNRLKHFYLKFSLNFERNLRCVLVCVSKIEKLIIFSAHFVLHIVTGCSPTNNHFKKEFEKTTEVSRKIEPAQSCSSVLFRYWGRNLPETKCFMQCMFDFNVSEISDSSFTSVVEYSEHNIIPDYFRREDTKLVFPRCLRQIKIRVSEDWMDMKNFVLETNLIVK